MSLDVDSAWKRIHSNFSNLLALLADDYAYLGGSSLAAASAIIQTEAQREWTIELDLDNGLFYSDTAHCSFHVSHQLIQIFVSTVEETLRSSDSRLRNIISNWAYDDNVENFLLDALLRIFVAHELFHHHQNLGSTQYEDSDGYPEIVMEIDYQADLVALNHVCNCYLAGSPNVDRNDLAFLLTVLHINAAHSFDGTPPGGPLDRRTFFRIFVWYFQASRIAAATEVADLSSLTFRQMPRAKFNLIDDNAEHVYITDPQRVLNRTPISRQDIVLSVPNSFGILRIVRIKSSSEGRESEIIDAVLNKDLAQVRSALQEVFDIQPGLCALSNGALGKAKIETLATTARLADELCRSADRNGELTFSELRLARLIDNVSILISEGILGGARWAIYKDEIEKDFHGWLQLVVKRRMAQVGGPETIDAAIRHELDCLNVRLQWALEEITLQNND